MSRYRSPFETECPTNSRDAYWEGRDSRSWDRNPYEHGADAFASYECRRANEEWEYGHRAAERERERAEEERIEEQRAARRAYERQQEELSCEPEPYYPEPPYPEPEYPEPEPEGSAPQP